jgi:uncharacterized protein (TIGR02246 family)
MIVTDREGTMLAATARSLILLVLVLGGAPAAIGAQHTEFSQAETQAIKVAHEKFSENWNQHDATAIAALFTTDSLLVTPTGIFVGRQGIESSFKKLFDRLPSAKDFSEPVDHVQMLSNNAAIVAGTWTIQSLNLKGYWSDVFEREGQDWRIRLHSYAFTPEAPPASR